MRRESGDFCPVSGYEDDLKPGYLSDSKSPQALRPLVKMTGLTSRGDFEQMLTGGHPNSLGLTPDVVEIVLCDHNRLEELFECLGSDDEVVRMRAGDALEKVCRERSNWFEPYVNQLLTEVAAIDQPSVQWHLAQMLQHVDLDSPQRRRAVSWLWRTFDRTNDWIVISEVLTALVFFSRTSPSVRRRLPDALRETQQDPRKAVARRATKLLGEIEAADPRQ